MAPKPGRGMIRWVVVVLGALALIVWVCRGMEVAGPQPAQVPRSDIPLLEDATPATPQSERVQVQPSPALRARLEVAVLSRGERIVAADVWVTKEEGRRRLHAEPSGRTGGDGIAAIEVPKNAADIVVAARRGYVTAGVAASEAHEGRLTIELEPAHGVIVECLDLSGVPVAGLRLALSRAMWQAGPGDDGSRHGIAGFDPEQALHVSDSDRGGLATFSDLSTGLYELWVWSPDWFEHHRSWRTNIPVPTTERLQLRVAKALACGVVFRGDEVVSERFQGGFVTIRDRPRLSAAESELRERFPGARCYVTLPRQAGEDRVTATFFLRSSGSKGMDLRLVPLQDFGGPEEVILTTSGRDPRSGRVSVILSQPCGTEVDGQELLLQSVVVGTMVMKGGVTGSAVEVPPGPHRIVFRDPLLRHWAQRSGKNTLTVAPGSEERHVVVLPGDVRPCVITYRDGAEDRTPRHVEVAFGNERISARPAESTPLLLPVGLELQVEVVSARGERMRRTIAVESGTRPVAIRMDR